MAPPWQPSQLPLLLPTLQSRLPPPPPPSSPSPPPDAFHQFVMLGDGDGDGDGEDDDGTEPGGGACSSYALEQPQAIFSAAVQPPSIHSMPSARPLDQ